MNIRQISFLLLLLMACMGCERLNLQHELGEITTLGFQDKVIYQSSGSASTEVKFTELLEDSRCPEGGECIWVGRAVVRLQVNQETDIVLGLGDLHTAATTPIQQSDTLDQLQFTLVSVSKNTQRQQGGAKGYSITIRVESI